MPEQLTTADLAQFTGSENWYRHALVRRITFTDGAHFVAEKAGAFWLLDEVALANCFKKKVKAEPFQVWKLKRNKTGHGAKLAVEDGNGNVVYRKRITFTDFPLAEFELWFTDNVILLPSEY